MQDLQEFIPIFKEEVYENLTKLEKGLVELEKKSQNKEIIDELFRIAHTIKGSARVFGFNNIQEIAHRIEDIFDSILLQKSNFSSRLTDIILKGVDIIREIIDDTGKSSSNIDISGICSELENYKNDSSETEPVKVAETPNTEKDSNKSNVLSNQISGSTEDEDLKTPLENNEISAEQYIRVPLSRINKLMNLVSELSINRMGSSLKYKETRKINQTVKNVTKNFLIIYDKLKENLSDYDQDFIDIEHIEKVSSQISRLEEQINITCNNVSEEAFRLDPIINELQDKTKKLRMLPLATILKGFHRMVRDIAKEERKKVDFEVYGEDTELDKNILEGIKSPLLHVLRNCIDHGIESPETRIKAGKSETGNIRLSASYDADKVLIIIDDDGCGISVDKIKKTALSKKVVSQAQLDSMSNREILNLIFLKGFSTSSIITDISGRGIGLDVVKTNIENLKGNVNIETNENGGTRFVFVLPLTVSIVKTLLVESGGMILGIPATSVERNILVEANEISTLEGRMAIQLNNHSVPLVFLKDILKLPSVFKYKNIDYALSEKNNDSIKSKSGYNVVVISSFDQKIGFIVNRIVSEEEVFIKGLGSYIGKINNVSGGAILNSGDVVIILDPPGLVSNSSKSSSVNYFNADTIEVISQEERKVLVVDDALATRELVKSIFESHGYHADTAYDGLNALNKASEEKYDLIVTDIQMPKMDGFDLCKALKSKEELKDIPVIIVSSLEKDEYKRRGIEAGAQAYITKLAFDQSNLLETVERLIG